MEWFFIYTLVLFGLLNTLTCGESIKEGDYITAAIRVAVAALCLFAAIYTGVQIDR